jgi:hypothetical protein
VSDPQPVFVRSDATSYAFLCHDCVREKNSHGTGRAWAVGEDHTDVTVIGPFALDVDKAWVTCAYGHDHLVLREGSDQAVNVR